MLGLSSTTLSSNIHFMLVHFCSTFGRVRSHPSLLYTHFTFIIGDPYGKSLKNALHSGYLWVIVPKDPKRTQ